MYHTICPIHNNLNKQTNKGIVFQKIISASVDPGASGPCFFPEKYLVSGYLCQGVGQNRLKNFKEEIFQIFASFLQAFKISYSFHKCKVKQTMNLY